MTKKYAQNLATFVFIVGLGVWHLTKGFIPRADESAAEAAAKQWSMLGVVAVSVAALALIVLPFLTYRAKLRMSTLTELQPEAVLFLLPTTRELRPVMALLQRLAEPPQPAKKLLVGMQSASISESELTVWRGGFTPEPVLSVPRADIVSVVSTRVLRNIWYYPAIAVTIRHGFDLTVLEFVVLKSRGWYRREAPGTVEALALEARRLLALV